MEAVSIKQFELPEEKRKGIIFIYFLGAIWAISALNTAYDIYIWSAFTGALRQEHLSYIPGDILFLLFFGLLWWAHRWYPKLVRHIFLVIIVVAAIFLFPLEELDRIFVALTLPIIMAGFLIKPIYSFAYYALIASLYTIRVYQEGSITIGDPEFSSINLSSLIVAAVVAWLIAQSLDQALSEARTLNRELDQRVQDRTQELAQALDREHATAVRNTTILESIADGVLAFDANQQVIIANPAAKQLFDQSLTALTMPEVFNTIEEDPREMLKAWAMGQEPANQTTVKFERSHRTISANLAPVILTVNNGKQVDAGHVMVLRDFTKEAELERAKDMFLGMVSHELRTPMSAIKGYVEILLATEKDALSKLGYEHLQTVQVSIKQLLKLANELIDLSRMETGEIDLYCQWVDLVTIVNHAAKIVQQEFTTRNLSLKVNIEQNLPKLYLDRDRILQVLLNLLSNAYKYTAQGGATIAVTQADDWVHITVTDTGIGIKEVDQVNLFGRFFRATEQFVQEAGGTGLGLNISKGFTELHGGLLTFESKYEVGTTFNIALPKNRPKSNNNDSL